ncbi:MAG: bifunctional folylpolyglutamate synthase/dihydrofolate synthase [Clostridia bacterium]|nr:bifunctional folylpolyglutamate synthase/dihydrofolate synthase [Clostridia bacterium]
MNIEEYLSKFHKGAINPSLRAMEFFMDEFDHPEKKLKTIHIAGTNGKGSITEMITKVLMDAGYKVGKYMGPHLIKYNERISINNKNISDIEAEKLINKIDPKIEEYNSKNDIPVTVFELETTMAFLYFEENKCDFVILETGLGGLYDSTNICNPLVSIISNIGYDHMHILGNTLPEIAVQKAGIIKENSNTIFASQEDYVNKVIYDICKEKNNAPHIVFEDDIINYSYDKNYQKFDYKQFKDILINLKGYKQCVNASIVIECVQILNEMGYKITEKEMKNALKTIIHKARFETISKEPLVIYDGAHNKPAIDNLKNTINMYHKEDKKVYIISMLKTKDYRTILKQLCTDTEVIYIFTSGNGSTRYIKKEELLKTAKTYLEIPNMYAMDLEESIKEIKNKYMDYTTFIIGSFYIYGDVLDFIKKV